MSDPTYELGDPDTRYLDGPGTLRPELRHALDLAIVALYLSLRSAVDRKADHIYDADVDLFYRLSKHPAVQKKLDE